MTFEIVVVWLFFLCFTSAIGPDNVEFWVTQNTVVINPGTLTYDYKVRIRSGVFCSVFYPLTTTVTAGFEVEEDAAWYIIPRSRAEPESETEFSFSSSGNILNNGDFDIDGYSAFYQFTMRLEALGSFVNNGNMWLSCGTRPPLNMITITAENEMTNTGKLFLRLQRSPMQKRLYYDYLDNADHYPVWLSS